jgi:putative N6-adenine-specific DNA methylase
MNSALEKRIKKHIIGKQHRFLAVSPLGFEQTLVRELEYIRQENSQEGASSRHPETQSVEGSSATPPATQPHVTGDGKVEFTAKITEAWKVIAFSRIANRVLMEVASFKAENFREFEKKASEIPWELYLSDDKCVGRASRPTELGMTEPNGWELSEAKVQRRETKDERYYDNVILRRKASKDPVKYTSALNIHVTCKHSRLYHSDAIVERLQKIIDGGSLPLAPSRRENGPSVLQTKDERKSTEAASRLDYATPSPKGSAPKTPPQNLYVTLIDDRCTIWLDLAGEELYKRGHERFVNDAPLKETIAAAMLFEAFDATAQATNNVTPDPVPGPPYTLLDLMSGSGTFSLEAAYIANKLIPGVCRDFALKHQPAFKEATWNFITRSVTLSETKGPVKSCKAFAAIAKILTSDISERAVSIIKHNIESSPLANITPAPITPQLRDFFSYTAKEIADACGDASPVLVLNPPYGKRLDFDAPKLYTKIGKKITELANGLAAFNKRLTVAILAPKDDTRDGSKYTCTANLLRECPAISPEHNKSAKIITTSHGGFSLNAIFATI